MRKERNNFFQESNMSSGYYYNPQPQMMPQANIEASSSFYMNQGMNQNINPYTDFDSRLARLERQVNKLESRISKLENIPKMNNVEEINQNTNMYMI